MQSVFEVYYLTVTGVGVGCSQYLRFTDLTVAGVGVGRVGSELQRLCVHCTDYMGR